MSANSHWRTMLSGPSLSIHWRRSSKATGRTFFQPVRFHLQSSDLLIKFRSQCFVAFTVPRSPIAKGFRQSINRFVLPPRHLVGMHAVMRCDLLNRPLTLDGFQRNPSFHVRAEISPLSLHHRSSLRRLAAGKPRKGDLIREACRLICLSFCELGVLFLCRNSKHLSRSCRYAITIPCDN